MQRRHLLLGAAGAALCLDRASAQAPAAPALPEAKPSPDPYHRLQGGVPHHLTGEQEAQRVVTSPAPKGAPGRWRPRAAMPIPRSEMAWATAAAGRMHVVGGYGEGRVDRAYHHIYEPASDRWLLGAPLPRGANHVAVAALEQRVYALGGFIEQNRNPDTNAYVYEIGSDRWTSIAPLPRARGAAAAVFLAGKLHLVGGAGAPTQERASVGWHEVYDPQADAWTTRKPLPGARDHVGIVADRGLLHVVGGRFNTFEYNTGLHHVYLPDRDTWEERAPLPTPRSGHGLVVYRGRHYAMGGEFGVGSAGRFVQSKVFGQMESYDPGSDSWQSHAPMPTPRHAVAAVAIGDWIYVAGGGAVLGGGVQSAVHEAFTLDA
ncbi:MAG TPA: galactose oxidase [Caldimonas sp.]|jgi:N-acetylneuraminic acid mutarotase|nr:galactose oxidase [Caldimonas sp.]HEX2542779.1 galactose oxidase [Caldimonas sp.]